MRKWRISQPATTQKEFLMEAERINLIGTQLSDLSARTLDLRGYL